MLNRRTLFKATTAVSSVLASIVGGRRAAAANLSFDVEERGTIGRLERLPTLDVESRDHFFVGVRRWRSDALLPAARRRFNAILEANGHDPREDLPLPRIIELVQGRPPHQHRYPHIPRCQTDRASQLQARVRQQCGYVPGGNGSL